MSLFSLACMMMLFEPTMQHCIIPLRENKAQDMQERKKKKRLPWVLVSQRDTSALRKAKACLDRNGGYRTCVIVSPRLVSSHRLASHRMRVNRDFLRLL
ncbi:hypothetical protein J3F84DRAFT_373607 [Trichoderma pleuroticola]